jgi:hypothetical protein
VPLYFASGDVIAFKCDFRLWMLLATCFCLVSCLAYSLALHMKADFPLKTFNILLGVLSEKAGGGTG